MQLRADVFLSLSPYGSRRLPQIIPIHRATPLHNESGTCSPSPPSRCCEPKDHFCRSLLPFLFFLSPHYESWCGRPLTGGEKRKRTSPTPPLPEEVEENRDHAFSPIRRPKRLPAHVLIFPPPPVDTKDAISNSLCFSFFVRFRSCRPTIEAGFYFPPSFFSWP